MSDRLPCVVPGCRCTMRASDAEPGDDTCLCRKHWPLTNRKLRLLYHRRRRLYKADQSAGHGRAIVRIWGKLTAQAIERSMGIA